MGRCGGKGLQAKKGVVSEIFKSDVISRIHNRERETRLMRFPSNT